MRLFYSCSHLVVFLFWELTGLKHAPWLSHTTSSSFQKPEWAWLNLLHSPGFEYLDILIHGSLAVWKWTVMVQPIFLCALQWLRPQLLNLIPHSQTHILPLPALLSKFLFCLLLYTCFRLQRSMNLYTKTPVLILHGNLSSGLNLLCNITITLLSYSASSVREMSSIWLKVSNGKIVPICSTRGMSLPMSPLVNIV